MPRIILDSDTLRAEIDPHLGAAITDLSLAGPGGAHVPILRRAPANASFFNDTACYLLAPWSNRIPGGAFSFAGTARSVRTNWHDGSAIHGDVCTRAWTLLDRSPVAARLELDARDPARRNWPWPYRAVASYEVRGSTLRTRLTLTNESDAAMPAGLGFHPFFSRCLWDSADRVHLRAANTGRYPCAAMTPTIPTGPARPDDTSLALAAGAPLDALGALDDVFAGSDGRAEIHWPASGVRARFECSPDLAHLVIYSQPAPGGGFLPFFCLEPVSMVNNGFNLLAQGQQGTGVRVLAPGEEMDVRWDLILESTGRA